MRVVLDPNVLVSGLIGKVTSAPRVILDALAHQEIEVVVSETVLGDCLVALARRERVDAIVSGDRDLVEAGLEDPPVWTPQVR